MSPFVRLLTKCIGVLLALIGVLGFFVDPLLTFSFDTAQNSAHIILGLVALAASSEYSYSRLFLIIFGLLSVVVAVLSFVQNGDILGYAEVTDMEPFLYLILGVLCLTVGLGSKKK